MLASIVVDYLSETIWAKDVSIAYMYCIVQYLPKSLRADSYSPRQLLKQLLQERRFIPKGLKKLYEHYIHKSTFPVLSEVSKILNFEIGGYSKAFVVINALGECPDDVSALEILLSGPNALQTINPINLMVTSRPILKIEQKFQKAIQLEAQASDAVV